MKNSRKVKIAFRISSVLSVSIAAFWVIWYIAVGHIPAAQVDHHVLPVSRWWDILFGPVWINSILLVFASKKVQGWFDNADDNAQLLASGVLIGSLAGLYAGWFCGLGIGWVVAAAAAAVFIGFSKGVLWLCITILERIYDIWDNLSEGSRCRKVINWLLAQEASD